MRRTLIPWLTALLLAVSTVHAEEEEAPWVLVDSKNQVLSVLQGGKEIARYEGIAIGRGGTSALRTKGDGSTPLGSFKVAWINEDSPFRLFFGFDFPTRSDAERARSAGVLSDREYERIRSALDAGEIPPQNTALGGRLGIHGIGGGDPKVHRDFNWTRGCIALTNTQIDSLSEWVAVGTRVVVR